jgi:hypothetical protein
LADLAGGTFQPLKPRAFDGLIALGHKLAYFALKGSSIKVSEYSDADASGE